MERELSQMNAGQLGIRRESFSQRLDMEKARLEERLAQVNRAQELLHEHPEFREFMDIVTEVGAIY